MPGVEVSASPTVGVVSLMVGRAEFTSTGVPSGVTAPVSADVAIPLANPAFDAVTRTESFFATSPATGV